MAKDKNINIKIKADSKEAKKGIDKVTTSINKLNKDAQKSGLEKMNKAAKSYVSTLKSSVWGTVIAAELKLLKKLFTATTENYNAQLKAEVSLQQAAKNNPYLNANNVEQLKQYASELQKISSYGDEELLPLMTQLAASGRKQTEIQEIMSAALDVSASGAMSLESAVKNLNKTYGGVTGELGELIPEVKKLTKEQLLAGDAVDLLKRKYEGMSEAATKATGSSKQRQMAWGDFKEQWESYWKVAIDWQNNLFTKLINRMTKTLSDVNAKENGNAWAKNWFNGFMQELEGQENPTLELNIKTNLKSLTDKGLSALSDYLNEQLKEYGGSVETLPEAQRVFLELLQKEQGQRQINARLEAQVEDARKKANEQTDEDLQTRLKQLKDEKTKTDEQRVEMLAINKVLTDRKKIQQQLDNEKDSAAAKAKQEYEESLLAYEKEIEYRKAIGDDISEQEEIEGRLKVMKEGLLKLLQEENNVTINNWDVQNHYIKDYQEQLLKLKELNLDIPDFPTIDKTNIEEATEILIKYKDALLELQKGFPEISDGYKQLAEAIKLVVEKLNSLANGGGIGALSKEAEKVLNTLTSVFSQISSSVSELSSLLTDKAEAEKETQILKLDEALDENLISEEEYNKKKEEIEKEAAEKQYKIQMWEWGAKCLSATADIASAVIKAYSTAGGGWQGLAMGGLMAAAGAVQLASVIAAKPIPPSYATGGVVGGFNGASIGDDNTYIHARNGEMILNANQQKNLFDSLKLRNNGGLNVNVKNYMGNSAEVSTSLDAGVLNIIIDKRVQEQVASGAYNKAFAKGEISRSGINITN